MEVILKNGNYNSILGLYKDNGKYHGNYNRVLGLYKDNGEENGSYYIICSNFHPSQQTVVESRSEICSML